MTLFKRIPYRWLVLAATALVLIGEIVVINTRRVDLVKQPVNTQNTNSSTLDKLFSIADNHNIDGAAAAEFGGNLLKSYNAAGPKCLFGT